VTKKKTKEANKIEIQDMIRSHSLIRIRKWRAKPAADAHNRAHQRDVKGSILFDEDGGGFTSTGGGTGGATLRLVVVIVG
jgi:hypothetical protein